MAVDMPEFMPRQLVRLKCDTVLGTGRLLSGGNIGIVLCVHAYECNVDVQFLDFRGISMVSELALEPVR